MKKMFFYLGIDLGNTKTQYVLADETGRIIGSLIGSGTNHQEIGRNKVFNRLNAGIDALLLKTDNIKEDISFAYLGVCGADTPDEFVMLRKLFEKLLGSIPFDFNNDGIIALKNGVELDTGIVVTCGTGNTNFAINEKGEFGRIGGLSDYLGDNLGAEVIARKATYAAVKMYG